MGFIDLLKKKTNLQLSQEQVSAAMHGAGPALTLAVPGSGKTTLLLCRTVYLIEELNVPANKILTVTFSKAAALDMSTRYKTSSIDTTPTVLVFRLFTDLHTAL